MAAITWDDSLAIGVDLIDEQHKQWVARLNGVAAAVDEHKGVAEIAGALSFLSEYTQIHFATEERHMAAHHYPGLEDHCAKHQELRDLLARLEQDYREDGATHGLAEDINTLLANWLREHIKNVDQAFGAFLDEQGLTLLDDA